MIQFYDSSRSPCSTLLEDCGFCAKGEGGPFVAEGHLRRGGRLPLNTDGGGLSSCHSGMRGIFLIIEAVRQLRGQARRGAGAGRRGRARASARAACCRASAPCCSGRERDDGRRSAARQWKRPKPAPDAFERPFFEAAARGELLYQRCPTCGHRQFYPRAVCTACGADPEWATAVGRGVVHTFTVVRQNGMPPFKDELPYVVAMVELPEGVRMLGNVTGVRRRAGARRHAASRPTPSAFEPGLALPFWRAAR